MHHVRTAVCPDGGAAGSGAECSSVSDHKIVSSNPRTEQEIHTSHDEKLFGLAGK